MQSLIPCKNMERGGKLKGHFVVRGVQPGRARLDLSVGEVEEAQRVEGAEGFQSGGVEVGADGEHERAQGRRALHDPGQRAPAQPPAERRVQRLQRRAVQHQRRQHPATSEPSHICL